MVKGAITTLPKWAQEYIDKLKNDIKVLEMRVRESNDRLEEVFGKSDTNSGIFVVGLEHKDIPLPKYLHIRCGGMDIRYDKETDTLSVRSGLDGIYVYPDSTNAVNIKRYKR